MDGRGRETNTSNLIHGATPIVNLHGRLVRQLEPGAFRSSRGPSFQTATLSPSPAGFLSKALKNKAGNPSASIINF